LSVSCRRRYLTWKPSTNQSARFSHRIDPDNHEFCCFQSREQIFRSIDVGEWGFRIWIGRKACRQHGRKVFQMICIKPCKDSVYEHVSWALLLRKMTEAIFKSADYERGMAFWWHQHALPTSRTYSPNGARRVVVIPPKTCNASLAQSSEFQL
jgi:hypothetical protein